MNEQRLEKDDLFVLGCGTIAAILCMLPLISSLSYSIDDYHLWSIYDINMNTMGYNFYSTGRIIEGIIAHLLYIFNVQPLNKPLGLVFFAISLAMLGMFIGKALKIVKLSLRIIIVLLFTVNPFFTEIYYYSNITVYSGFAIFFLWLGIKYSMEYWQCKKKCCLIMAVVFYYLSLGVYQIFYPIVGFLLIILVIKDILQEQTVLKKYLVLLGIYIGSFLLFYVILKVMFFVFPPTLIYEGIDLVNFIKGIFTSEYWNELWGVMSTYLLGDNIFNSKILFIALNILVILFTVIYLLRKKNKKSFINSLLIFGYIIVAPILCFGLGLARLDSVSGRSLTSFGIYEVGLFIISHFLLSQITIHDISKLLVKVFACVIFLNGCFCGKGINTVLRLNSVEENMVNRIVYRMEEYPEFTGRETLVIFGVPQLGEVTGLGVGDFGTPASATFSKVFLFNEVSGYMFQLPSEEQQKQAREIFETMDTWPAESAVMYYEEMFIVRLYW